jgi:RND family efflux transporter MFP subunit
LLKDDAVSKQGLKRKSKNRRLIWSVMILAIALSGTGYYYYNRQQASRNNQPVVATTTISTGDIVLIATGPGTLVPSQETSFGFKNSGQVRAVLVKLGDSVKAGQVLAQLENTTLALQYQQAQANLAALTSPSQIAAAQQALQDARDSFATARNNLQFLIGPDMLVAEENVAAAQENLQLAQSAVEKDASDANQQKVAQAKTALTTAQEALPYSFFNYSNSYTVQTFTYPIRNSNGVTVRRQLFAPTDSEILSARAAYELAKGNLSDAQNYLDVLNGTKTADQVPASSVTQITEAQTALDLAKANLDATSLIAPISGTITSISLNVGDNVGTSAVVTISNTSQPYIVDVNLDETDWDKAVIGNDASVTFDLLPNKNFSAKVVEVYPALDSSSGTSLVHIRVQLNSKLDTDLPSAATASVDVTGGKALGVVTAPVSALKETQPGKYVVYLMKNGKPVAQDVEVGLQSIVNVEVKSGLKPGDVVLTNAPLDN